MKNCSWNQRIEAYHDGEAALSQGVQEHLAQCGECREYFGLLQGMRAGVAATRQDLEIGDAQFRVFMDGIREGIEARPTVWVGFWSKVSMVMAGLVLVTALTYIVTSGPVRTWAAQYISPVVDVHESAPVKPGHPGADDDLNPATKGDL